MRTQLSNVRLPIIHDAFRIVIISFSLFFLVGDRAQAAIWRDGIVRCHPDFPDICVGATTHSSPGIPHCDEDGTCEPVDPGDSGTFWEFVQDLPEGADTSDYDFSDYFTGLTVRLTWDCRVFINTELCGFCERCEGDGDRISIDCTSVTINVVDDDNNPSNSTTTTTLYEGRKVECESTDPFLYPLALPEGTNNTAEDVIVNRSIGISTLEFGFFAGVMLVEPSHQEIEKVMEQINAFYSDLFMHSSEIDRIEVTLVRSSFNLWTSSAFPFKIEFDTTIFFSLQDDFTLDMIPSNELLVGAMDYADYDSFIQDYVWSIGRDTMFFYTQRVEFNSRPVVAVGRAAAEEAKNRVFEEEDSNDNKKAKKKDDDTINLKSYDINSHLDVTFFPATGQEPSQAEIDALLLKTDEFFSQQLATSFPDVPSFTLDVSLTSLQYDASVNKDKVLLEFETLVQLPEESGLTTHQVATILSEGNYNEFIADFMRKTAPWTHSVFDNTHSVIFKAIGSVE